jgi:iron(III) transport system ATP-binding protein
MLLLDEPLSALDVEVRRELRGLIRQVIVSSGVPALLVTHDLGEAEELGDVIVQYRKGHVVGTRAVRHDSAAPSSSTANGGGAPT